MGQIQGTKVAGQLTVGDPTVSKYGTHYSFLGTGGYHEVFAVTDRNAISVDTFLNDEGISSGRRRLGMKVFVIEENKEYVLGASMTSAAWTALSTSQKLAYLADNANWSLASSGGEGLPLSKILIVNPNGFAGTPERGSLSKTYQHPNDAIAAAQTGDYIIVLGGNYSACTNMAFVGGIVTWDLRGATLNFVSNQPIINHGGVDGTTYIFGSPDSKITKVGNSQPPITGLSTNSVIHIDLGVFEAERGLGCNCKEFIFKCRQLNWNGSTPVFIGSLSSGGFFRFSGKVKNIKTDAVGSLIDLTAVDNTAKFLFKDVQVEDLTSGVDSLFGAIKFSSDVELILDNFSSVLKTQVGACIDAVNISNAKVKLLTPAIVNRPWGTSGTGSLSFSGSTIHDIVVGTIRDGALQQVSKVISTDSNGNKVQTYQVDDDETLSADSASRLTTQRAIKAYIDSQLPAGSDGVKLRGSFDITTNPAQYPKALAGSAVNATQTGNGSLIIEEVEAEGLFTITEMVGSSSEFTVHTETFVAGTDFTVAGILSDSIQNLVDAINADSTVNVLVEAINNADGTVTIKALTAGTAGNSIVIEANGANTASGATLSGGVNAETKIAIGDAWFIKDTPSGTIGPGSVAVNNGDLVIALVEGATNLDASWLILESPSQQATETQLGLVEIGTDAEVQGGTDNEKAITPLKLKNWWDWIKTPFAKPLFVDINGDNSTAAKGDINLPYQTIQAAITAASVGDVVVIMAGTYTATGSLLKNGISFISAGPVVINHSSAFPMSDSGSLTSCKWDGDFIFNFTHTNSSKIEINGLNSNIELTGNITINDSNTNKSFGVATVTLFGQNSVLKTKNVKITTGGRFYYAGRVGPDSEAVRFYQENCYFKSTSDSSCNHVNAVFVKAKNCTYEYTSDTAGTGAFSLTRATGNTPVTSGTLIFENCKWIDHGNWMAVACFATSVRPIFIGENVIYCSSTAVALSANTAPSIEIDVIGTLYSNNAFDSTITYNIGSIVQDTGIYYEI